MKTLIAFAPFWLVKAGEIILTCEQAEYYCGTGIFIPPGRICTSYPDETDGRGETCLSDEPWICHHLDHFRQGRHNEQNCVENEGQLTTSIGAKMANVRLWNVNQSRGQNLVPFFFKRGDFSRSEENQIRAAFREISENIDCVQITEVSASSSMHKIQVHRGRGCSSYLGRVSTRSGFQTLSLGRGCVVKGYNNNNNNNNNYYYY